MLEQVLWLAAYAAGFGGGAAGPQRRLSTSAASPQQFPWWRLLRAVGADPAPLSQSASQLGRFSPNQLQRSRG